MKQQKSRILTFNKFQDYLKTLETITDCNSTFTQDECGPICTINTLDQTVEFGDYAIIDGWEYDLTYSQKEILEGFTFDNIDTTEEDDWDVSCEQGFF